MWGKTYILIFYGGYRMTVQELKHIIEISGSYDTEEPHRLDEYLDDVHWPLVEAIEANEKEIIDYLMQRTPEELFFVNNTIDMASEDSKQPEIIELHNKIIEDYENVKKVLSVFQKQVDNDCKAGNDSEEYWHFDISADMVEGIHLSPTQIELWGQIIEQTRLNIEARRIKTEGKAL
jgi:hypothetical protein